MAEKYLEHPIHGLKVANSDAEARSDVENGWRLVSETYVRDMAEANEARDQEAVRAERNSRQEVNVEPVVMSNPLGVTAYAKADDQYKLVNEASFEDEDDAPVVTEEQPVIEADEEDEEEAAPVRRARRPRRAVENSAE